MTRNSQKVRLHVVDLAFALFAAEYVKHDDLQEGTSFEELEAAGWEHDNNVLEVSWALGRYAFWIVSRYEGLHHYTDRRSNNAHAVRSSLRRDFHASGVDAPG